MTDIAYFTIKKRVDNYGFYLLSNQSFQELKEVPALWERFDRFMKANYLSIEKVNGNYKIFSIA